MGREPKRRQPAATYPEQREQQIASMAYDLAEKQILDGTATSQVITHFLKAGSSRDALEKQKLHYETLLQQEKINAIASMARQEELYANALKAMSTYSGRDPDEEDEEYYDG